MSVPLISFASMRTPEELKSKFTQVSTTGKKIKVLIVPGHEPDFGGTEFKDIKERELVLGIAEHLTYYFKQNPHYEVFISRTKDGWSPEFEAHFKNSATLVDDFVAQKKREFNARIETGGMVLVGDGMPHNDAPSDVARRLFAINHWANTHDIDITLHLHINDSYPRKSTHPGEYSGLAIYMPELQFQNAKTSQPLALAIYKRLSKFFATSNLDQESNGLIQNQDLIAIGSYNTAESASLLIEYGYIYEPQFQYGAVRDSLLKEFALQTYLGVSDFMGEDTSVGGPHKTTLFPRTWKSTLKKGERGNGEILALQAALTHRGFYPPSGMTQNDCPLSGSFGKCTVRALAQFQKRYKISGDGTILGVKTRAVLNRLYGVN